MCITLSDLNKTRDNQHRLVLLYPHTVHFLVKDRDGALTLCYTRT